MNKVANTYWTDARLATQRPAARALSFTDVRSFGGAQPVARRENVRQGAQRETKSVIPSSLVFSLIIVAMFAICFTVSLRTHAEMSSAVEQYETMNAQVEDLRNTNTRIKQEVQRLRTEPKAIEAAARARLGMVRPNEIIIPVRSEQ